MTALPKPETLGEFYIPATASLQERRPRTLKHDDTFGVFDRNGDVLPGDNVPEGLYHRDTRHLSRLELTIGGVRPMMLSSTLRDDNAMLTVDLTNPDMTLGPDLVGHDLLHLRRSKFVYRSVCFERIALRNYADEELRLPLELRFGSDFADLFEVRGKRRPRYGQRHAPQVGEREVLLLYDGLDSFRRQTRLRFDPAPDYLTSMRVEEARARFDFALPAAARTVIYVEISCNEAAFSMRPGDAFLANMRNARREMRTAAARAASIATSNEIFNEAMRRSISDLTMLVTGTESGPYPYAGIPWYSTAFGRDALITALQTLWMDPVLARGVLGFLAAEQATEADAAADSEPGKILHEVRHGEMANLGEVPFRRYYGSVDSTPLFVILAGAYLSRTGDLAAVRRLWPNVEAALGWIDKHGDRDGDGFVEYWRQTDKGLANQGWKDSYDSVFHADGSPARGPIALVEVQGYVCEAKRHASAIARALGRDADAARLEAEAVRLRDRIDEAYWSEEIGTYALALDGDKRPCCVRSSNAGHLLFAGVPRSDRAGRVARQLLGSSFFSGWGVRTLAADEPRYNPMSYHNGSVWPHDNAMIGLGLSRYGFRAQAARVLEGLFDACTYIELRRLPELVCGFPRRRNQGPTFYPVACAPQAWSSTALPSLLQSCFGIEFNPAARAVQFNQPYMPACVDEVILRGLAVDGGRVDVALRGRADEVSMQVLSRQGDMRAVLIS